MWTGGLYCIFTLSVSLTLSHMESIEVFFKELPAPTRPNAPRPLLSLNGRIYVTWYTSGLPEATGVRLRLPNSHAVLGVKKHSLLHFILIRSRSKSVLIALIVTMMDQNKKCLCTSTVLVIIRNIGHQTLPKIWVGTFLVRNVHSRGTILNWF